MEQVSIEQARRTLGEIVDRARLADQVTLITRQGKPAAVVVSAGSYEAMLAIMADAATEQAEKTRAEVLAAHRAVRDTETKGETNA